MNSELLHEVVQSGYVHRPLPVHEERRFLLDLEGKEVIKRKVLWSGGGMEGVYLTGSGSVNLAEGEGRSGGNALVMRAPVGNRQGVPTPMVDVSNMERPGIIRMHIDLKGESLEEYNRFSAWVRPEISHAGENVEIIEAIVNTGKAQIPDKFWREGLNIVHVKNHQWNHILWEIQDLPRDRVDNVFFYVYLRGAEDSKDEVVYYVDGVAAETVERPEFAHGWSADYPLISYSTAGYDIKGPRTAIASFAGEPFCVKEAGSGRTVLEGTVEDAGNERGRFGIIDFTAVSEPGDYYIETPSAKTRVFPIGEDVLEDSLWRSVNAFFCARDGYPVEGRRRGNSYDFLAEYNGKKHPYVGAWHDQFSTQSNEIIISLLEAAERMEKRDAAAFPGTGEHSIEYLRLVEEAEWGLDMALRVRYGGGFRGTCVGSSATGEVGDVAVRVTNHPIDNFISASALGYAAYALRDRDPDGAARYLEAAREDFGFADSVYREKGFFRPDNRFEHVYGTSESLFFAMASAAASRVYIALKALKGETPEAEEYAKLAGEYGGKMLECQEKDASVCPIPGFFYRDKSHRTTVHFNHQAREHYFMQALLLLCTSRPESPEKAEWEKAMRLYADFLKEAKKATSPYGMLPAGIYAIDEVDDPVLFELSHPGGHPVVKYDEEKENLREQITGGIKLNERFYLRAFPVWFSFKGNALVHLESGKAATILGRYFGDEELVQMGREQIYWIYGKNPFNQCLMYGAGYRFGPFGSRTGDMPLGIECLNNEDVPYYPQGYNGVYRETWSAVNRGFLLVLNDLLA